LLSGRTLCLDAPAERAQGHAEDLISRYLTAALYDSLKNEQALDLGIDAAASLERAVAAGLEDDEPDTGLYGASLTRLTGLAGILDTYVEAPAAEAEDQRRISELGRAATQTTLATVFPCRCPGHRQPSLQRPGPACRLGA
jgi:hypothetical protein